MSIGLLVFQIFLRIDGFLNAQFLEINILQEQRADGKVIVCMEVDSIQKSVASVKAKV